MFQRTVGQIDTHRADINRGNLTPLGSRTGSRKDGFSQALPAEPLSSSPLAMPQLASFQLGDHSAKPLTYNSGFGLPGSIDRRQSAASVASSGSDLLDSFHRNGAKKKAQALFKTTPRAHISLPCDDLSPANTTKPSAANTAPSAEAQSSAEALVRIVNEVDTLSNPKMDNKADKTNASTTVGDHKTSRDSAVERLSSILKGDRLSIERSRQS